MGFSIRDTLTDQLGLSIGIHCDNHNEAAPMPINLEMAIHINITVNNISKGFRFYLIQIKYHLSFKVITLYVASEQSIVRASGREFVGSVASVKALPL
jgi:hypothetical protein